MAPFIGELSAQLTERLPLATLGDDPYDGVMKKEAAREAMLRGTTSFSSVLANELPTFADTGSFACKTTEVVQFCTTDDTVANDFDFSEARGMYQESTFNTNTVGNAADSESFADVSVPLRGLWFLSAPFINAFMKPSKWHFAGRIIYFHHFSSFARK